MTWTPEQPIDLSSLPPRIHRLIDRWVGETPDAVALADAGGEYSFQTIAHLSEALAVDLTAAGLRAGDRLVLVCENCVAAALFVLAASRLDLWLVPVNARLARSEIETIASHSGARALFFTSGVSAEARAHARSFATQPFAFSHAGEIEICTPASARAPEPVHAAPEQQVAVLIYTSGTTGNPKGVMLSHRSLAYMANVGSRFRITGPGDRIYCVLPVTHIYGIASVLLGMLCAGARLDLVPRFSASDMARALREDGISAIYGVPAMYAKLLDHYRERALAPQAPKLRSARSGGSPLDLDLKLRFEAAFGLPLGNGYGLTEAAATVATTRPAHPRSDRAVGQRLPDLDVELRDVSGAGVAAGEVGTLHVRGPNIMLGYYRDEAATRAVFDARGFYDTGDLARMIDDEALEIVGRVKELIIRSGFNVYPPDIEQAINAHPDVVQSAVVGRSVEGNEEVIAFAELAAGAALTPEILGDWLRQRLAAYKVPGIIIFGPLPVTSTGKILKGQLKTLAASSGFNTKGS